MTTNTKLEELAEQLHIWYLEACKEKDAEFNPAAQKPYAELPEGSKFLDRYIAEQLLAFLAQERAQVVKEIVEMVEGMYTHHGSLSKSNLLRELRKLYALSRIGQEV